MMDRRRTCRPWSALVVGLAFGAVWAAAGRAQEFDPGWRVEGQPYLKLAVVSDGVYRFSIDDVAATGASTAGLDPATFVLLENGREVPLWDAGDETFAFVGRRNRGNDEAWAYDDDLSRRSSTFHSLYSDTTVYWLTWGTAPGIRYLALPPDHYDPLIPAVSTVRDTLHREQDVVYYFGDSDDAAQPAYTRGEGYYDAALSHTATEEVSQLYDLVLDGTTATGDSVVVEVKLSGSSLPRHRVTATLEVNGAPIGCPSCAGEADWSGYDFRTIRVATPQSMAPAGVLRVRVTSHNEFNSVPNRVLVDGVRAANTRTLSADVPSFATETEGLVEWEIQAGNIDRLLVLNPSTRHAFELAPAGGSFRFADSLSAPTRLWFMPDGEAQRPVSIRRARSVDWAATNLEADYLIVTTPALEASARALAEYRAVQDGYRVEIVVQADLFDQFDYGRPTPMAIRRFVQATRSWASPPQFLVFWGDALRPEDNQPRRALQPWEVIPFGYSPTDGWFAMTSAERSESVAVGRIPVRDNATGAFFVEKLARYEQAEPGLWKKRLMLLVGGQNESEQNLLQSRALRWGDIAAGTPAGMDTLRFFKSVSAPLDPSFRDSLSQAFRDGAAWLSYFGHSAANTWEIVTDDPENYDNAERLPIVLSMGCNTGNFAGGRFETSASFVFGERLVLASASGAIAHWGSSSASTITLPAILTNHVHEVVFQDTVRVLGLALQEAKRRFDAGSSSVTALQVLLQYGLIGDPATHIQIARQPDFTFSPGAFEISPINPVPADSALLVSIHIQNLGLVPPDSLDVRLTQLQPSGQLVDRRRRLGPVALTDTLLIRVPIIDTDVGTHRFSATLDPDGRFAEEDETNNAAEKSHTVFSTGLTLLSPFDYETVGTTTPRLRVALSRAIVPPPLVQIELDTLPTFDSPALQSTSLAATGLVADWVPPRPLDDGGRYYWRAAVADDAAAAWRSAAFSIESASTGFVWSQSGNLFAGVETDPFLRWDSDSGAWAIEAFDVSVSASAERGNGVEKGQFVVNGVRYESVTLGFGVLVLDGSTGALKSHHSFPTYRMSLELEERFDTDSTRAVQRFDSVLTGLAAGDYVFLRTRHLGNLSGPTIQPEIKARLMGLGSAAIDTLDYNDLWIAFVRAGFPAETVEWVEPAGGNNEIIRDTTLTFLQPEGVAVSPSIGPAKQWEELHVEAVAPTPTEVRIDVLGADGAVVIPNAPPAFAMGAIDARQHPYLRLRATFRDPSRQVTPQLLRWALRYMPAPELAIAAAGSVFSTDTLAQAEPLVVTVPLVNLGPTAATKAWVKYTLTDRENRESLVEVDTLEQLTPDQTLSAELTLDTSTLEGSNRLSVRLEQEFEEPIPLNNLFNATFEVRADRTPPAFDVFVDEEAFPHDPEPVRNLQDPALPFVSSRPTIRVSMRDDNLFLRLEDTTSVRLQLDGRAVLFNRPDVTFEPATAESPEAQVLFTPDLSGTDTTHTLVVRVFDVSGNEGAGSPYQVHFRIQSAVEVESLYPYPNPMHTATTFAFQLRGADASLAEAFRLRIYTIDGRLVKEFDLVDDPAPLEAGTLRIGWNKLRWDGRDADGDLVATGVYLYHVVARADGQGLRINNDAGIEKLVVIH